MIVSIHQPQYIPWIPYFLKIKKSDIFVLLDNVAYQKNGIQNRNQIKGANGPIWLTVPVNKKLGQLISTIKISNDTQWQTKHINSIKNSYSSTNYYSDFIEGFIKIYKKDFTYLADLNIEIIKYILLYLDIKTTVIKASELNLSEKGSDLILQICRNLKASKYISGVGGKEYLREIDFTASNIEIEYKEWQSKNEYKQNFNKIGFVHGLSSIDYIFNCGNNIDLY